MASVATVGTLAKVGAATYSLVDANKQNNKKINYYTQDMLSRTSERKNILEEQLAKRRASLSAMGIGSSSSALAAEKRLIDENQEDINNDSISYTRKIKELEENNSNSLNKYLLSNANIFGNKLIK